MNIYNELGYIDMNKIMELPYDFIFVVAGRGTGKTYSALNHAIEKKVPFILLRTTDKEVQLCANEAGNPFKTLNRDKGYNINIRKINDFLYGIYEDKNSSYSGLVLSLTCFSKTRGLDFSDVQTIIYDEFIPEKIVKRINGIGESLLNAYETVNRNRELQGRTPVKLVCLANALNVNNEIIITFGLASMLQRMKKKKIEVYEDKKRSILLIYPMNSPISQQKKDTALYRINQRFNDMSLGNEFRGYYEDNIQSKDLKNYYPFVRYDDMFFYRSKTDMTIYVTKTIKRGYEIEAFDNTDFERKQFIKKYAGLVQKYYKNRLVFENAELELQFINIFTL